MANFFIHVHVLTCYYGRVFGWAFGMFWFTLNYCKYTALMCTSKIFHSRMFLFVR